MIFFSISPHGLIIVQTKVIKIVEKYINSTKRLQNYIDLQ